LSYFATNHPSSPNKPGAIPSPPPGYGAPIRFQYPTVLLIVLNLAAVVLMGGGIAALLARLHGLPNGFAITLSGIDLLIAVAAMLAIVVVHELIHALTAWGLGYRITFGFKWSLLAPYVAAFHQFIPRRHNLLIALAPLIVLTALLLPLLTASASWALIVAFMGLVVNTAGAVGDLYLTWRLLRLPRRTLLYDVSIDSMFIYLPQTGLANK
jgi:hypothetical protein